MERPIKRRKAGSNNNNNKKNCSSIGSSSFLNHLAAEGPVRNVLSFCDFQTLLRLRYVDQGHKRHATEAIEQKSQQTLDTLTTTAHPIEHENTDYDNPGHLNVKLQSSWSEKYDDKDELVDEVMGRVYELPLNGSNDMDDDDGERARNLLEQTGWLDVEDFDEERDPDWERLAMASQEGMGENGWNVEIRFKRQVKRLVTAKKLVDKILNIESYEERKWVGGAWKDVTVYDLQFVDPKVLSIRHAIMCLLWSAAHPQSLKYTSVDWKFRHQCYPSGDYSGFLYFRTLGGQRIELNGSNSFERV